MNRRERLSFAFHSLIVFSLHQFLELHEDFLIIGALALSLNICFAGSHDELVGELEQVDVVHLTAEGQAVQWTEAALLSS